MDLAIEMTGKQDREGPWKIAIAGFPGSGKTLLASTAPEPIFVFFQENPRIKSIARRHIAHVKLLNRTTSGGLISVQDQLGVLVDNLAMGTSYKTLVVDTGDELYQAMKEGRRLKNGGEFGIGDWGWLADAYRAVIATLIDLPMTVIVLYHIKAERDGGDEGYVVRDLLLQGASQPEAPGWFDVVGVLETFEAVDAEGDSVSRRVLLTKSSRTYPWLKDHSGALPPRFEISDNFVGDFDRLHTLLTAEEEGYKDGQEHQTLEVLTQEPGEGSPSDITVPSPEELREKKSRGEPEPAPSGEEATISPEPEPSPPLTEPSTEGQQAESPEQEPPQGEDSPLPLAESGEDEAAFALAQAELGGTEVFACATCGVIVDDESLREVTQIRFRKYFCRPHFKEALAEAKSA